MARFFTPKIMLGAAILLIAVYGLQNLFFPQRSLDGLTREERLSGCKNVLFMGVDVASATASADSVPELKNEEKATTTSDLVVTPKPGLSTAFVLMYNAAAKSSTLLVVPEGVLVYAPEQGLVTLQQAYSLGGQPLAQQALEEMLGLRLDNYAQVDYERFGSLLEDIGGVDMAVTPSNAAAIAQATGADVKTLLQNATAVPKPSANYGVGSAPTATASTNVASPVHLSAPAALSYLRSYDESGAMGRVLRQQQLILALRDKIVQQELLLHNPGLSRQLVNLVQTDLSLSDMVNVGKALQRQVQQNKLSLILLPTSEASYKGKNVQLPAIGSLRQQLKELQGGKIAPGYNAAAQQLEAEYKKLLQ